VVLKMDRQMKSSLYMLYANNIASFMTFWAVIACLTVLTITISYLFPDSNNGLTLSGPVYIYGAVIGAMLVTNFIPYLVKLGVTRQTVFLSAGLFSIALVVINALLVIVINVFLKFIFPVEQADMFIIKTNENTVTFSHISDIFENSSLFSMATIDISISFFMLVIAFMIALLFYRYGMIIGFLTLGVLIFAFIFSARKGWIEPIFWHIFSNFDITFFYKMFILSLILYSLSYFMLRNVAIKT